MQAVRGRQKGGHGPRRSLRKPRKLGMRVRQLVLSYDDFRYMKFIYLHCGEETNVRDSRS